MINHILQEDSHGCGLACLAMITGQSYQQVKADFANWDQRGVCDFEIIAYLGERGYSWNWMYPACSYKRDVFPDGTWKTHMREVWPPPLWANLHIASVELPAGFH